MTNKENNKRKALSLAVKTKTLLVIFCCVYRIINALLIQTQFDPDEYWQNNEVAYCLIFSSKEKYIAKNNSLIENVNSGNNSSKIEYYNCALTWEWKRSSNENYYDVTTNKHNESVMNEYIIKPIVHGPIRSYINVLPTILLYYISKKYSFDSNFIISKGPILLNAIMVVVPIDLLTFYISSKVFFTRNDSNNNEMIKWLSLLCSLTNWFHGYGLIRTYSNSFECLLFMIALALLSQDLFDNNEELKSDNINKQKLSFLIGGISTAIRFTSITLWIPMGLYLCYKKRKKKIFIYHTLIHICALYGLLGILLGICIDSYIYEYCVVLPFLSSFYFNVVLGYSSLYGCHPLFWYFYAGLPAISGIFILSLLFEMYNCFSNYNNTTAKAQQQEEEEGKNHNNNSNIMFLLAMIFIYTTFHSFSSHKEFRFLLPILPLICILSGNTIHYFTSSKNRWCCTTKRPILLIIIILLLFTFNLPHFLFLAILHQRAPLSTNQYISNKITNYISTASVSNSTTKQYHYFNIHYLLNCHSSPTYSHLHIPNVILNITSFDCSPSCRLRSRYIDKRNINNVNNKNYDLLCQSDQFSLNPYTFLYDFYNIKEEYDTSSTTCDNNVISSASATTTNLTTCVNNITSNMISNNNNNTIIPNFVIIHEEHSNMRNINQILQHNMGLRQVSKFRHTIKNINLYNTNRNCSNFIYTFFTTTTTTTTNSNDYDDNYELYDCIHIFYLLDVTFDHFILYSNIV